MESDLLNSWFIYLFILFALSFVIYLWVRAVTVTKRVNKYFHYKDEISLVMNASDYMILYQEIVRWTTKLGYTKEDEEIKTKIFTQLKERKDFLGIKKNPKVTYA
jgi:hypothetical protein